MNDVHSECWEALELLYDLCIIIATEYLYMLMEIMRYEFRLSRLYFKNHFFFLTLANEIHLCVKLVISNALHKNALFLHS